MVATEVRQEIVEVGRRWRGSLVRLGCLAGELGDFGGGGLDGGRACAHWIADALDVEVCTAREWLRIGRALQHLPQVAAAFEADELSYTKVRQLTRVATAATEAELLELAARTPAGRLGVALAAWSARYEDEQT